MASLDELKMGDLSNELSGMKIENDLRRQVRSNIAHHRSIGSYIGKRHAAGYPVHGQNTRSNARTARKLNKVNRRG
jgi:small subunit ribosomal protein S13